MRKNIILLTDSYKASHYAQYPPGSEGVYSYFESRGGRFDEVVLFGLQYILREYLEGAVVTQEAIEEAASFFAAHFGDSTLFNCGGWQEILERAALAGTSG